MPAASPQLVILAGPNGAGKTTISREVLHKTLGIANFVNADTIAAGLSGFDPDRAAFAAGRIMLARLKELAAERSDFAFETTLASRTFAPWIRGLTFSGYRAHLIYVWVRSPRLSVLRVRARVKRGGHSVPELTIRRRYARSAANLFRLYLPLVMESNGTWQIYDNSGLDPRIVAEGEGFDSTTYNVRVLNLLKETGRGDEETQANDL